jgi:DNA-binding MarR family transcriptional regulator
MSAMLQRMEQAGWIVRAADETDGRAVTLALTDAGEAELTRARHALGQALQARVDHLDPAELATLVAAIPVLDRLLAVPAH